MEFLFFRSNRVYIYILLQSVYNIVLVNYSNLYSALDSKFRKTLSVTIDRRRAKQTRWFYYRQLYNDVKFYLELYELFD